MTRSTILIVLACFVASPVIAQSKLDALKGFSKTFNDVSIPRKLPPDPAPNLRWNPPELAPVGSTSAQVGTHVPFSPSLSSTFNDSASRF